MNNLLRTAVLVVLSLYISSCEFYLGTGCMGCHTDEELLKEIPQKTQEIVGPWEKECWDLFAEEGVEVYELAPEEEAKMEQAGLKAYDKWLLECAKLGKGGEARQLLKEVIAYVEKISGKPWTGYKVN